MADALAGTGARSTCVQRRGAPTSWPEDASARDPRAGSSDRCPSPSSPRRCPTCSTRQPWSSVPAVFNENHHHKLSFVTPGILFPILDSPLGPLVTPTHTTDRKHRILRYKEDREPPRYADTTRTPLGSQGQRDILLDPGHVARHSGVHPRGRITTQCAPAHDPYLDPGAIPATHQGAPGVTLWGEAGLGKCFPGQQVCRVPHSWARGRQRR